MIWLFACLTIAVAALFYVFYLPGRPSVGAATTGSGYLHERKDAVYENLGDLNFEYKAGKVPEVDYASLKSSLQDEAATLLAEIASWEANSATAVRRRSKV